MKRTLLIWLYRSGALPVWHMLRNRRTLTVIIFHRVHPFDVSAPLVSWPGWTVTPEVFEQCLRFFRRHYSVVSLTQVLAAAEGQFALPPRALLVTFDDGWADTQVVASPVLRR